MTWPPAENGRMPAWALTDSELSHELGDAAGERLTELNAEREARDMLRASIPTAIADN